MPLVATARDAFIRAVGGAAEQPCLVGNEVTLYQNGNEIFPPMLAAIREARSTVHFSTYVYWAGHIPEVFATAFSAAARRGVIVRLVLDSEGTESMSPAVVKQMSDAGCVIAWFHRVNWFGWTRYNRRTHRRLLIVDGKVGFTGGVGIGDEWAGNAKRALGQLEREVTRVYVSAARSVAEGLEETLTLHRLGVYPALGLSFKTTN